MPYSSPEERRAWARRYQPAWNAANREKARAYVKKWQTLNPDKVKDYQLRTKYNITLKDFDALRKKQRDKCAICQIKFEAAPHVDHNHSTGAVRGLLCGLCNKALGLFYDNIASVERAARYLRRHS